MAAFVLRFLQHAQRAIKKVTGCTLPTHLPPPVRHTFPQPLPLPDLHCCLAPIIECSPIEVCSVATSA